MNIRFVSWALAISLVNLPISAFGQAEGEGKSNDFEPSAKFLSFNKEAGFTCGQILPNQIPGLSEMMPMCGGRAGLKTGKRVFMEPALYAGAAKAQRYLMGSISFRGDMQFEDLISSIYGGGDIHYITTPTYAGAVTSGEETNMYFGAHVGGSMWWEFSELLFLRMDFKFNLNPGTSLYVGVGFTMRFGGGGDQEGS